MARIRRCVAKKLNRRVEIVSCYKGGYDGYVANKIMLCKRPNAGTTASLLTIHIT
jgi:hypothetical protein